MTIILRENNLWHLSCLLEVFALLVVIQLWGLILESLLLYNLFRSETSLTVLSHLIKWRFLPAWFVETFSAFLLLNMVFNNHHLWLINHILNSCLLMNWWKSCLDSVRVRTKTYNLVVASLQNWMNGKPINTIWLHLLVLRSFH